jgi:hypothetical protein
MSRKRPTPPAGGDDAPTAKKLRAGRTSANTRFQFWTQFATPLLYHWLNDFAAPDGDTEWITEADSDDRDKIIQLLVHTKGLLAPDGEPLATLQQHWRTANDFPTGPAPGLFQTGMPGLIPLAPTPPTSSAPAPAPITQSSCSGCLTPYTISPKTGATCLNPACGQLRADLPFDHLINATARTATNIKNSGSGTQDGLPSQPRTTVGSGPYGGGAPSHGSSASVSQSLIHTSDAAADLDGRSVALRDAAAAAIQRDYPSYSTKEPMTVASALAISAQAVKANDYLPPSEGLIAYIRSGALTDISFALPIPAEAVFRTSVPQRGHQDPAIAALLRQSRGATNPHRTVSSLADFGLAFAATVGPALIEQPTALAHWLAFYRSVIEIHEATHSWSDTVGYIARHLQTRIHRRESIGPDDQLISNRILLMAQATVGPSSIPAQSTPQQQTSGQVQAPKSRGGQKPGGGNAASMGKRPCRFYNGANGCKMPAAECTHAHVCSNCSSMDHKVSECSSRPKGRPSGGGPRPPAITKQEE